MSQKINNETITRIAPSPTGHLHLGHVLHILWVSAIAKLKNAQIKIRLEDHDRLRCKPEYATSIASDLHFLSLSPFPDLKCFHSVQSSTHRQMRYLEVYQNLYKQELLYACQCTRKDYDSIRGSTELRYPGHCSEKKLKLPSPDQLSSDVSEVPFTVRLRIPENEYCFTEQHNSKIICEKPRNLYGDPVIRDRSGQWTYQYCVVIDDLDEEINLIVRGADLQSSTSRQLAFHMMLENERHISFLHHPLILNSQGFKLSKSIKSPPINSLRASGMSKEEIFGTALGLNAPLDLDKSIQSIQLKLTKDLT